jgi:site-specific recombinase XerC
MLRGDAFALGQFREYLCKQEVIAPERIPSNCLTAGQRCAHDYERYLRGERLLAPATIVNYVPFVSEFLKDRFGTGPVELSQLRAADVVRFVRRQAPRLHVKRAKLLTTALRSFLDYGCYLGQVRADLVAAVPIVASWSMPLIPRAISPDQVRRVLAHVDRSTAVGKRDYAILLLLARLGLRAGEIVSLELEDIDWNASSLSVRGKGGRRSQLPLPKDVGDAIVGYLQHGRPRPTAHPLSATLPSRNGSRARISRPKRAEHRRSARPRARRSPGAHPRRSSVSPRIGERDAAPRRLTCRDR